MYRSIRAAYLFDILEIMDVLTDAGLETWDVRNALCAFLEYKLFKQGGFNIVRSLSESYYQNPYQRYLDWKIPTQLVLNIFDNRLVPSHLRCEECYLYWRNDSVLIVYY
jgi:hypothetical protein